MKNLILLCFLILSTKAMAQVYPSASTVAVPIGELPDGRTEYARLTPEEFSDLEQRKRYFAEEQKRTFFGSGQSANPEAEYSQLQSRLDDTLNDYRHLPGMSSVIQKYRAARIGTSFVSAASEIRSEMANQSYNRNEDTAFYARGYGALLAIVSGIEIRMEDLRNQADDLRKLKLGNANSAEAILLAMSRDELVDLIAYKGGLRTRPYMISTLTVFNDIAREAEHRHILYRTEMWVGFKIDREASNIYNFETYYEELQKRISGWDKIPRLHSEPKEYYKFHADLDRNLPGYLKRFSKEFILGSILGDLSSSDPDSLNVLKKAVAEFNEYKKSKALVRSCVNVFAVMY